MCKARVDVIQQNPYSLPRRSLILFGNQNQGLRVVLNTKRSLNYTGATTHIMWMKMVQNDMDSHKLTWTEAVNLAQNRPLCKALQTVAVVLQWQSFDVQAAVCCANTYSPCRCSVHVSEFWLSPLLYPSSLATAKIWNVLTFWYRLSQVVLEYWLLNEYSII